MNPSDLRHLREKIATALYCLETKDLEAQARGYLKIAIEQIDSEIKQEGEVLK
jgi:hypothetical protein